MANRQTGSAYFLPELLESRQLMSAVYPTAAEQYMLQLINRARANPSAEAAADGIDLNEGLAAGTISTAARQPLAFDPELVAAAESHSTWMITAATFAHNEGSVDPGAQMTAAGYQFTGSWTWGQNIAWQGSKPNTPPLNATTLQMENSLFTDTGVSGRGHRLNILNPQFQEVGVGIETGTFQSYNSVLATQDFAKSGSQVFLTGVAFTNADKTNFYAPGEGLGNITITATRASDQARFTTTTWAVGGYTLPLTAGTYNVTATGTGLGTATFSNVVIGSQNVEVDFTPGSTPPAPTPPPAPDPAPAPAPTPPPVSTVPPVSPPAPVQTPPPTPTPAPVQSPAPVPDPVTPSVPTTPGTITGRVYLDRNSDGVFDKGDRTLAGWYVYADLDNSGTYKRGEPLTRTNAYGMYHLKLAPGTYTIREIAGPRFIPTNGQDLTLNSGDTLSSLDFINQLKSVASRLPVA
jgi:uncharacterized protein YkwD